MTTTNSDKCEALPEPASPTTTTSTEIVTVDDTICLYKEALAETKTTVRDAAKDVIRQRIGEVEATRTLLAHQEADLAKLLKKTPAEIAMLRDFDPFQHANRQRGRLA
jgi:hypothetical protein